MSHQLFPARALSFATCAGVLLLAGCDSGELSAPAESPASAVATVDLTASVTKVDVCHRTTKGDYTKISIADAAHETHMDHGDGGVNGSVPGNEGEIFGPDCQPMPADPHCPCYETVADLYRDGPELIDSTDGVSWETVLTAQISGTVASASFDGLNGACAISYSDGSGQSYSPIHEVEALFCKAVLYRDTDPIL